jgi:hypothetical protein
LRTCGARCLRYRWRWRGVMSDKMAAVLEKIIVIWAAVMCGAIMLMLTMVVVALLVVMIGTAFQ